MTRFSDSIQHLGTPVTTNSAEDIRAAQHDKRPRRPTTKDVARLAGVSKTTVSYVLNDTPHVKVSAETRARVYHAVEQLGYFANSNARGLRTRSTRTLALLVPDVTNPFWTQVVRSVEDTAAAHGYAVLLGNSDDSAAKEETYLRLFVEKCVDGILLGSTHSEASYVDKLERLGVPCVLIDRDNSSGKLPCVALDNIHAGMLAAEHLVGLGHRRIGLLNGPTRLKVFQDFLKGYRQALRRNGLPYQAHMVRSAAVSARQEQGKMMMEELLALPDRPTAVCAATDLLATGALRALQVAGLHVPDDVAVVGNDDIPLASELSVPLTTVAPPKYELGATGVRMLLARIEGESLETQRVLLPVELIVRESCGASRQPESRCHPERGVD